MADGRGLPRAFEVVAAAVALALLSPILLVVGVAIKMSSAGPVLFRQLRVGRAGEPFEMIKFRSMRASPSGPQVTAAGDPRITGVGRVLRATKLDELPELWNVVRGDMSLVGPRPEVPRYVDLDDPRWQRVLSVRPGITDPVTLSLRDEESLLGGSEDPESLYLEDLLPKKLAGSAEYLDRRTALTDIAVLAATIGRILVPASTSTLGTGSGQ